MLRCVTYNIGFGFDNRNLFKNAARVYHFFAKNPDAIRKGIQHVDQALDLALEFDPDILCLNEIFPEFSGPLVEKRLRERGYTTVVHGTEAHHPQPLSLGTYLAVRWPGAQFPVLPPNIEKFGGGSGWCGVEVPDRKLVIYGIHPSLWTPFRRQQMTFLLEEAAKHQAKGRKVILIGDFNASLRAILDEYGFGRAGFNGTSLPTNLVPRTWPLSYVSYDDLDHVLFTPQFELVTQETRTGLSDHRLLFCLLREANLEGF